MHRVPATYVEVTQSGVPQSNHGILCTSPRLTCITVDETSQTVWSLPMLLIYDQTAGQLPDKTELSELLMVRICLSDKHLL